MQNSKNPRTDEFISTLIIGTIDRNNGRIAWGTKDIETLVSHARQLERELNEATVANEAAHAVNVQLRKELNEAKSWVKSSMESTAIAASTIALLTQQRDEARLLLNEDTRSVIVENDWLRKMVDAFAENGDCGDEWLMADYRELPHVRARKAK